MNAVVALAVSISLGVVGQLSLRAGALAYTGSRVFPIHPYILAGLALYGVSALFYIFALRRLPVSVAFPSVSISYVIVAYSASLIWDEPFGWRQVLALVAIMFGVFMLFQHGH